MKDQPVPGAWPCAWCEDCDWHTESEKVTPALAGKHHRQTRHTVYVNGGAPYGEGIGTYKAAYRESHFLHDMETAS